MKNIPLILASQSPRRKEILEMIGITFSIEVANVDETMNLDNDLTIEIQKLAYKKAKAIADKQSNSVVVGADTIVVIDNEVLGKPINEEDAYKMLQQLSGRMHQVITGVCVLNQGVSTTFFNSSDVVFNEMTDEEIWKYIKSKEPMDKAGAYGIQGIGGCFIKEIKGDFYSIMGLPLSSLYKILINIYA